MAVGIGTVVKHAGKRLLKSAGLKRGLIFASKDSMKAEDLKSAFSSGPFLAAVVILFFACCLVNITPSLIWNHSFHTNEQIAPIDLSDKESKKRELNVNNEDMGKKEEEYAEVVLEALTDVHNDLYDKIKKQCREKGADYELSLSNVVESEDYLGDASSPAGPAYQREQAVYNALKAKGYRAPAAVSLTLIAKGMSGCKPDRSDFRGIFINTKEGIGINTEYGLFALNKGRYKKWLKEAAAKDGRSEKERMESVENQVAFLDRYLKEKLGKKELARLKKERDPESCIKGFLKAFEKCPLTAAKLKSMSGTFMTRHSVNLKSEERASVKKDKAGGNFAVKAVLAEIRAKEDYPENLSSAKQTARSVYQRKKPLVDSWYKFLKENGFSDAAAAGALGNAYRESGWRGDARQTGGSAMGMFQWDGGRKAALVRYAKERGMSPTDTRAQQEYFIRELKSSYGGGLGINAYAAHAGKFYKQASLDTIKDYKNSGDPLRCFMNFLAKWERPAARAGGLSAGKGYAATEVVLEECGGLSGGSYLSYGAGTRQMALILSAFSVKEGNLYESDYTGEDLENINELDTGKTYGKYTVIKTIGAAELTAVCKIRGEGSVSVPQSMAYMGRDTFTVCYNNHSDSKQYLKVFRKSRCVRKKRVSVGHGNGLCYNDKTNTLLSVRGYGSTVAATFDGESLKRKGKVKLPAGASGIGYDRKKNEYCLSSGRNMRAADKNLKKKRSYGKKGAWRYAQDAGAYNGIDYSCVSVDKNRDNRINMYNRKTGGYLGTYKLNLKKAEIEDCEIDDKGHLLILINKRGTHEDVIYKSKRALAMSGGGEGRKAAEASKKKGSVVGSGTAGAMAWARMIAADDSFTYGKSPAANHFGCYFCGNQKTKQRHAKRLGIKRSYAKTYCCNPFVNAAFVHGAKDPYLKCKTGGKRIALKNEHVSSYGKGNLRNFKYLGHLKRSELKPGDIILTRGHCKLYLGGNKQADATGGKSAKAWKASSISVRRFTYPAGAHVVRYTGGTGSASAACGNGAENAAAWAVRIAKTPGFHYSNGYSGCYYCHGGRKAYVCTTFIKAAYAHGAGDKEMLDACKGKKYGLVADLNRALSRSDNWRKIPSAGPFKKGDVLINGRSHVVMSLGGNKIVHAANTSRGIVTGANLYFRPTTAYRYCGEGGGLAYGESSVKFALLSAIRNNAASLFTLNYGPLEEDEKTGKKYFSVIEIQPASAEQIVKEVFEMDPTENYKNGGKKTTVLEATTTMADTHMEFVYGNRDTGKGDSPSVLFTAGSLTNPLGTKAIKESMITSRFGRRSSPGGIGSTNHAGIDIGLKSGTKLYAAISGKVIEAVSDKGSRGYGTRVMIESGNMRVLYAHMSKLNVKKGQRVQAGEFIGLSGNTGASTGPHLHFEIRVNGKAVDPCSFLGLR